MNPIQYRIEYEQMQKEAKDDLIEQLRRAKTTLEEIETEE